MDMKNVIKCEKNISNTILIILGGLILKKYKKINFEELEEKIQILLQILLNRGYKLTVLPVSKNEIVYCKKLVHIFQDENITLFKCGSSDEDIVEIIKHYDLYINFDIVMQKKLIETGKPCILMGNNEDFKEYENNFMVNIEEVEIGKIIEKIEELINISYKNIKSITRGKEKIMKNDDFEVYKKQVKETITELVNNNNLDDAKDLIKEYESIVKDDVEVYSIKGVIAMMEGKMDEAEKILDMGMLIDSNDHDILYNSVYLYKNMDELNKHSYICKKLYNNEKNFEMKNELGQLIKTLGIDMKYKVLIGCPVHQKPEILREFLNSIKELNTKNMEVNYSFVDDNSIKESSDLLEQFSKSENNVYIYKFKNQDEYICDEHTHNWNEHLVWKVANFKDKIIKYAKQNKYDYLFFIDSDLVLHPDTLNHLISTGKDIISEIFWTKWQPNSYELPQVWLKDVYTQYHIERNENLNEGEIYIRHKQFIDKLRKPGIYEVGGLGACTLISKYAIDKGVSFKEIKNLSFWGEDRHFCVRAAALGIKLYVDTRYPAYHIYREKDLRGVLKYKKTGKKVNKKKIALVYTNLSGSNTIALYKLAEERIKEKYDISLVLGDLSGKSMNTILNSDMVIFTEGNYPFDSKLKNKLPIVLDLWHGFPLKAMGFADKGEKFKDLLKRTWSNVDYITSYSSLFNKVMNKCISVNLSKYIITGAQRNDFLFSTNGRKNMECLFNESFNNKKFIFYMPTYRHTPRGQRSEGGKEWKNILGFENFNMKNFLNFIEKNNCILFVKLHPAEESKFLNKVPQNKNIKLITNQKLAEKGIDLYEILNSSDVLITDYSSVYFDTLLIDMPVIFTPIDLEKYKKDRGMILEPYENWTPGPKCVTQESLQKEIIKSLTEINYYKQERKTILKKVYKYFDDNSCSRTWKFIDSIL